MKSSLKLLLKCILFTYVMYLTPFFTYLPKYLGIDISFISTNIYRYDLKEEANAIKDKLNIIYIDDHVMLSDEIVEPFVNSQNTYIEGNNKKTEKIKKVYIYNTHQQEEYLNDKDVVDASIELANQLQKAGIQVVYESHDFAKWLNSNQLDYNYSYWASNYYLNEAIVKHGGFDLIIDFHRDAIPRESSFIKIDDKSYAKMMFVVGGLSKNVDDIKNLSYKLTKQVNHLKNGVMKSVMIKEAYYNQDVSEKMVLIEVGSNNNTYKEVCNSTKLLGEVIIKYLMG